MSIDPQSLFAIYRTASIPFEVLEAEVLRLSAAERSHLLDCVVASLDADASLHAAWDDKAARRDQETGTGTSAQIPGRAFQPALGHRRGDRQVVQQ